MTRTIGLVTGLLLPLLLAGCPYTLTDLLSGTTDDTTTSTGSGDETNGLGSSSGTTTNLDLMSEAETIVQVDYPNSLLIEANGSPSSGSANAAQDIDQWRFVFVDDIDATSVGTVLLEYANGAFGDPQHSTQGWIGSVYERLPQDMSLSTALEKVREAGYENDFSAVTLRKPLTFPQPEEALYSFSLPGQYVMVGVLTGEVTTEIATE